MNEKLGTWLLSGKLQLCPAGDGADADAAGNAADTADKEGTRGTHFLHSRGSQVVTVQYLGRSFQSTFCAGSVICSTLPTRLKTLQACAAVKGMQAIIRFRL